MTLSTFHVIGIILFIVAALVLVTMMIIIRFKRRGRHNNSAK